MPVLSIVLPLHTESGRMLYDVPIMAASGKAAAVSVEVESTLDARVIVSQNCLHYLYTNTQNNT